MLALRLAFRNLMGAGLRTVLNVAVLSFAFVVIIFYNGLIDGWNEQARNDTIEWEYANGQLMNANYDRYDPFSIRDGHGIISEEQAKDLSPILIRQSSIYPGGRMVGALLKGIDPNQKAVGLPTAILNESNAEIPALIGKRMAKSNKLKTGDKVLLRWRDKNGTFDATEITIAGIFDCNVSMVDGGQIWIPIEKLWDMTGLHGRATMYLANENYVHQPIDGWEFYDLDFLLKELDQIITTKKAGGSIMYLLLLAIALLAIFDTQVLSVFRRQREIGTYIALGMTRQQVMLLFTFEGSMNSILATIVGLIYGLPLFLYMSSTGISFYQEGEADDFGISIADTVYPVYGATLILSTIALVVISATIVSFLPARKISKMNPVDALKGKLQ